MPYTLGEFFKSIIKPLPFVAALPALALWRDYNAAKQRGGELVNLDFGTGVIEYWPWLERTLSSKLPQDVFNSYVLPIFTTDAWIVCLVPGAVLWSLYVVTQLVTYFQERQLDRNMAERRFMSRDPQQFRYKRK